jgi:hypothetical protein
MALINTTTTGVLGSTFYGDGTGSLTVQQNGVTLGVYGNIPIVRVYRDATQSFTASTWVKVQYNNKVYDTANGFDTTNNRYIPNVAGYYLVTTSINVGGGSAPSVCGLGIYKNGSSVRYGPVNYWTTGTSSTLQGTSTVYLNGTTDYIEGWTYSNGTSPSVVADIMQSYFEACLIKAA